MRRRFAFVLVVLLVLSLCACGGATAEPATEAVTEAATEPVADITVYAKVPQDWSTPSCWAWQSPDGPDAFEAWPGEAMSTDTGWYTLQVPGWVNTVIINGRNGSVETADLPVESGRDVWIHVVNAEYAFVHYEEPTQEQLDTETDQPALDYHMSFFRGGYQVTDTKAVALNDSTGRYCTEYIPEELLAQKPEEAYYIVRLLNANRYKGFYLGVGPTVSATQLGVTIRIEEVDTGVILATSAPFMGGEPPESIRAGDTGEGTPPDAAAIEAWIRSTIEELRPNAPAVLPVIPINTEGMTDAEKAALEAKELAEELYLSYTGVVEWLVEYEDYTQEDAVAAADNCGVDWKEIALLEAEERIREAPSEYFGYYSYAGLLDHLLNIRSFTEEETSYAMGHFDDVDWMEQALLQAKWLTADENSGYSDSMLESWLQEDVSMGGYGFTREEAAYAVANCGADWAEEAVECVRFLLEYSDKTYTKAEMVDELIRYDGFTKEEATYGAEQNGLK